MAPDILSAKRAYYLLVFFILDLYFIGQYDKNMKFGYYKASSKLEKKKKKVVFLMECHRVIRAVPSKFQIKVMVTSLAEGRLAIISHLCAIKLSSFFHSSTFP